MLTVHVLYAFNPRQGDRSIARYHAVLDQPLDAGRLHRAAGDALCKPRSKFWGLHEGNDQEGLEYRSLKIGFSEDGPRLRLLLATAQDAERWRDWFTGHVVDEDWVAGAGSIGIYRYRYMRSAWRGWRVELAHPDPARLEAGVAGD